MDSRRERRTRRAPVQHTWFLVLYAAGMIGVLGSASIARAFVAEPNRQFFPDVRSLLPALPPESLSSLRPLRALILAGLQLGYIGPHLAPQGGASRPHGEPPFSAGSSGPTPDASRPVGAPAPPPYLSYGDRGLRQFRIKLVQLEKGLRRRVRVVHFGDSMLWYENTARRLRGLLQERYGDGGRAFVYLHGQDFGITLDGHQSDSKGFDLHAIPYNHFNHREPKWLPDVGFLGLSYQARPGARTLQWSTQRTAPWTSVTAIVRPLPGQRREQSIRLIDPDTQKEIGHATASVTNQNCAVLEAVVSPSRRIAVDFPVGDGAARSAYIDAVLLETNQGVSYSSVILKGRHMAWLTAVPEANFRCGWAALSPDLVVMQFGINESASIDWHAAGFTEQDYLRQAGELFARIQAAAPGVEILLIGPYERLKPIGGGQWVNYAAHDRVRAMQQELARNRGLAFFDSWSFLGGQGQLRRLIPKRLAHNDYAHLTMQGGDLLAEGVFRELMPREGNRAAGQPNGIGAPPGGATTVSTAPMAATTTATAAPVEGETGSVGSPILFNSKEFLWFFLVVLVVSSLLIRFPSARLTFLVAASWYFYASWKWWALSLIVGSTVLDYAAALGVDRARRGGGRGTAWLCVSLAGNLGLLFFFKYHDFFSGLLNPALPPSLQMPVLDLILPVGISFYTFQTLSYTIDVWRGVLPVERGFLRFALFVSFFPQLVAGPIVRAAQFLPGVTSRIRHFVLTRSRAAEALFLIFSGLFKKAIADAVAVNLVDRVFQTPQMYTVTETLAGMYGFAVQIYLDFSSYTDMALGCAVLLGFRLTENFRAPYAAVTISDFWRRWHISLGSWLRDYLYMSLGGNRSRVVFNLAVTMLLAGLWHGAGLNFVMWGAFHGFFLIVERVIGIHRVSAAQLSFGMRLFARALVFHVVLVGWVLFRCADLTVAQEILKALRTGIYAAPNLDAPILMAVAAPLLWHWLPSGAKDRVVLGLQSLPPVFQGCLGAFFALGAYRIASAQARAFLYFQF